MRSYSEYCPIAMGAEAIGDRWTPLILRELMCGSHRFSDIHRGVPRMSRTLLSQRLRHLQRIGLVEKSDEGAYRLTDSGEALSQVIWAPGDWAMEWLLGEPERDHFDGAHLMWRMHQRVVAEALPPTRTVVQFDLLRAHRGRRCWLVLDPHGATVCERDEGFDVDLWVEAPVDELLRVWMGRRTWNDAIASGDLSLHGRTDLVRDFTRWFSLSPFTHT